MEMLMVQTIEPPRGPSAVRTVQPGNHHICFHDCAHPICNSVRHQQQLPCASCGQLIPVGATLYILQRRGHQIQRQQCANCYESGR